MPNLLERQATAVLPRIVMRNAPRFFWTPTGLFVVVLLLGLYIMPLISWVFPILAGLVGFSFGWYTVPSWIPVLVGGLGSVYAIYQHRETGSERWGLLRWLFIPATVGGLINISDMGDIDLI